MTFDEAADGISTVTDLRRICSAHVVDHRNLEDDRLRSALLAQKPKYLDEGTVREAIKAGIWENPDHALRVISPLLLFDVLLNSADYDVLRSETEERVIAREQEILNDANELDLAQIAGARQGTERYRSFELYAFVLGVVWDTGGDASVEEVSLLRRLRARLTICDEDALLLDAQLGVFPNARKDPHSRDEIAAVRRHLQSLGLLFVYRDKSGADHDVIPVELAAVLRQILGVEVRRTGYLLLLQNKRVRTRAFLERALQKRELSCLRDEQASAVQERVMKYLPASEVLGGVSPRDGLSSEELQHWLAELNEPTSGSKGDRIARIIAHYDAIRPPRDEAADPRALWYELYEALACRDRDTLRAQHIIEKDIEIERRFEDATTYLFEVLLNHPPLQQARSNHADGLLSFKGMYLMWDNKSKDAPGLVNLREHLVQFDGYMEDADKLTPIFLVIGPGFTPESEGEAIRYSASHFGRNIVLITAAELKALADDWASPDNPARDEPFPLGLLARSGRFDRAALGELRT